MNENRNELEYNDNSESNDGVKTSDNSQPPAESEARELPEVIETKSEPIYRPDKKKRKRIIIISAAILLAAALAVTLFVLFGGKEEEPLAPPPHEHVSSDWITDVTPTCNSIGSRHTECVDCSERLKREDIPKTDVHTPVTDPRIEPTLDEVGYTEGSHCEVCGKTIVKREVIPKLTPEDITVSSPSFDIVGTTLATSFANSQDTVDFLSMVDIGGESVVAEVFTDEAHTQPIDGHILPLVEGNNVFYLVVSSPYRPTVTYVINIYRNRRYTVTFDTDGGTTVYPLLIEEGTLVTEIPTVAKVGYTFKSWSYDFSLPITGDVTVTAAWTPNTDTKYKVEYYLQNLENNQYTLVITENLKGTTGEFEVAEQKQIPHFTLNPKVGKLSGDIAADGSLLMQLYYDRVKYTVRLVNDNPLTGSVTGDGNYRYEENITLSALANPGYTFLGWYEGNTLLSGSQDFTVKVEKSATYVAKWRADTDVPYFVDYYYEDLLGEYSIVESETLYGATDSTVELTPHDVDHFTFNPNIGTLSGTVSATSILTLSVYYTRDSYTVTVESENDTMGTVTGSGSYLYDKSVTITATARAGYSFLGWYDGETLVSESPVFIFNVQGDVAYIAKWRADADTEYTVEYYTENLNGTGYTLERSDVLYGTTDTAISADIVEFDHFTFNPEMSTIEGVITADGSLVLSVYYTRDSYNVTVSANDSSFGTVTVDEAVYAYGDIVSVIAVPKPGYYLSAWESNADVLKVVGSTDSYYFTVEGDTTATAIFLPLPEMQMFEFTSADTVCEITGLKDDTVTEIIIPDCVTSIGDYAFSGGDGLTSVTIGDSVTSIGDYAFRSCSSLTSVEIGDSVTSIGERAFYGCTSLTSVEIGDSVTSIGEWAFYNCTSLTSVEIGDSVTSIGSRAFYNCSSLTSVTIGDSVTSIGSDAFYGCSSLESITVPFVGATNDGTTNTHFGYIFGAYSYSSNDYYVPESLKTVVITGGASIGSRAFYYCSSLTSVEIGDSVTYIGDYAFYDCLSLTSVHISDIAKWCEIEFADAASNPLCYAENLYLNGELVTELVIPDSVTSIGNYAFRNCSSLTSVEIGDSVTSIGSDAFSNCRSLTSVEIGDSVTSIGEDAFYNCSSLTSVTIPDSVTSIGDYAFRYCSSLTSINYNGTKAQWNSISKDGNWNYGTGSYTVYCSDGEFKK